MPAGLKPIKLPIPNDSGNHSAIDPLDSRYYDNETARYLSEASRITYQAYVESALAQTLADFKICSSKVADEITKATLKVTSGQVYAEEALTKHDIKALVNTIKKHASDSAKPYVHFGATSYDIVATASALQMRDALRIVVIPRLKTLLKTLIDLTLRHADTPQIGRTHGQHAVPITFGFALAEYVSRLGETILALEALCSELRGKFSGAVGAHNGLSLFVKDPLAFEKAVLAKVKLEPAEYSNQIVPPEAMVRLMDELTITAGIMANISHDMRHLQRSEIAEVSERFDKGQTGSSTMAHKRNPISFENIVSMSKQVIAQSVNANLNLTSEHQRDLTDSAASRFYTLSPAIVASMAQRLASAMGKLEVDVDAMGRNMSLSGGAIAAEPLYLLMEKYGHTAAHEKAKTLAHQALATKKPLVDVITKDKEAASYWRRFSAQEKKVIQSPDLYYNGLAAVKARTIANSWKKKL